MSTRSATIVRQHNYYNANEYKTEELFRFYRHCDGYPSGHGADMAKAFMRAENKGTADKDRWISSGLNNRNWVQKCFAELFADYCDLEVEAAGCEHWDIDYLYVVTGRYAGYGGKENIDSLPVTIAVYSAHVDGMSYDAVRERNEPLFEGSPKEFLGWTESGNAY